jgi:hypothetical protein
MKWKGCGRKRSWPNLRVDRKPRKTINEISDGTQLKYVVLYCYKAIYITQSKISFLSHSAHIQWPWDANIFEVRTCDFKSVYKFQNHNMRTNTQHDLPIRVHFVHFLKIITIVWLHRTFGNPSTWFSVMLRIFWYVLPCRDRPDDGGSMYLWDVGRHSIKNTAVHPRRFWASYLSPWELEISHDSVSFNQNSIGATE